jgi:trigger factor
MDSIVNDYANYMAQQGIRLEDYLKMIGSNIGSFRESNRATAERQARTEVLLGAVADAEGIEISDDDLKAEYQSMADAYGLKPEEVEKYVDVKGLTADLKRRKAVEIITSTGVAVEPKEKKEIRKPGDGSEA